jgi:EF hand domain-containing protein
VKRRTKIALLVIVACLAAAPVTRGDPLSGFEPPAFESLDRNKDGRLSRSEAGFDRYMSAHFGDSDVNGDGFVSYAEYVAMLAQGTGGLVRR